MVYKTGGKLKGNGRWRMNGQKIEVVDEFSYLGVTLESTGWLNKQKMLDKTKGYHGLIAIDKCISVNPNVNVQTLETIYEMVCESKIMCY